MKWRQDQNQVESSSNFKFLKKKIKSSLVDVKCLYQIKI
jgi:hypothetical protein